MTIIQMFELLLVTGVLTLLLVIVGLTSSFRTGRCDCGMTSILFEIQQAN
jgi:hypothetical protein